MGRLHDVLHRAGPQYVVVVNVFVGQVDPFQHHREFVADFIPEGHMPLLVLVDELRVSLTIG